MKFTTNKYFQIYLGIIMLLVSVLPVKASETGAAYSGASAALKDINTATWIVEGKGKRIVYIFFDPNCPSCQSLYKNLRGFVKSNQYQFRWIPVAIVNPTSLGKAAAMLEAKNPQKALQKNEEHYKAHAGGLDEHIPSMQTERKLAINEGLLNKLDIPVIPSMLFIDKNNKTILIQGALSPLALRKVFKRLP